MGMSRSPRGRRSLPHSHVRIHPKKYTTTIGCTRCANATRDKSAPDRPAGPGHWERSGYLFTRHTACVCVSVQCSTVLTVEKGRPVT